jgi:uncharacterized protein (TIGR02453 family)
VTTLDTPRSIDFRGFRPEALQFLVDLTANNERSWFQPRKGEYERLLKEPLEQLCVALAERFEARGIPLLADPARSPFRIHRDVRFSKDKSPYKTNIGASFPWIEEATAAPEGEESRHVAGGYFHLSPEGSFIGGGMWHPEPARLAAFRSVVANDPASVHAVLEDPAFRDMFGDVGGDRLKRVPRGYAPDHPEAELLKLKDVGFHRTLDEAELFSPRLPDTLADALGAALPVLRFLNRLA